jgi:catechol 2,3-dioxygenase-like lactoylglutathione lyase family enzyme
MAARLLEHVNVRTVRFAETVRFYEEVLGLNRGHYPGKVLPGAWIYDEENTPVLHIVDIDPTDSDVQRRANDATVPRAIETLRNSGAIDHLGFVASDYNGFVSRLKDRGIPFKTRDVQAGLRQIYISDPNEILIELNFREASDVE